MKTFLTVIISIAAAYMLLHSAAYNLGKNAAFRDMRKEADSCLVAGDYDRAYHLYNAIYTNKPSMIEGEPPSTPPAPPQPPTTTPSPPSGAPKPTCDPICRDAECRVIFASHGGEIGWDGSWHSGQPNLRFA